MSVRVIMQSTFQTTTPDQPLYESQKVMVAGRKRPLRVVADGGNIVGLLTVTDINETYRFFQSVKKPNHHKLGEYNAIQNNHFRFGHLSA